MSTRGGRRPGAGAPKGNKNALRHGRHSADAHLREAMASLTAAQRNELLPYIREGAKTINRRRAWIPPAATSPGNLISFPSFTTTTHAEQSNPALAHRMTLHGFVGAAGFLHRHSPAAPIITLIIDYLDALDPHAYAQLRNPGGLLRQMIHEEIADHLPQADQCPYCGWTSQPRKERTS